MVSNNVMLFGVKTDLNFVNVFFFNFVKSICKWYMYVQLFFLIVPVDWHLWLILNRNVFYTKLKIHLLWCSRCYLAWYVISMKHIRSMCYVLMTFLVNGLLEAYTIKDQFLSSLAIQHSCHILMNDHLIFISYRFK